MYSVVNLTSVKNSNTPKDPPIEMEAYTCKYQLDKIQPILQIYGISVMLIS